MTPVMVSTLTTVVEIELDMDMDKVDMEDDTTLKADMSPLTHPMTPTTTMSPNT